MDHGARRRSPTQETVDKLAKLLDARRHDRRRRQLEVDRRQAPRQRTEKDQGIEYIDVGVSGGVWGLEVGYCMMVGGPPKAVKRLTPILDVLAPETTPSRAVEAIGPARLDALRPVRAPGTT